MPNPSDQRVDQALKDRFVAETKTHWTTMYRLARQLCQSATEADDILQTALIRALKYYERIASTPDQTDRGRLAWLLKITKNVYLDSLGRSGTSWATTDLASADEPTDPHQGGLAGLPQPEDEEAFFRAASTDETKAALDRLNPQQRSILYLTAIGYQTGEIGELLDIPLGTVLSARARAIKRLRQEIGSARRLDQG